MFDGNVGDEICTGWSILNTGGVLVMLSLAQLFSNQVLPTDTKLDKIGSVMLFWLFLPNLTKGSILQRVACFRKKYIF